MTFDSKNNRINNILSLVKLGGIVIICIVMIKNTVPDSGMVFVSYYTTINFVLKLFISLSLTTLYYLWSSVFFKKIKIKNSMFIPIMESVLFLIIFMVFIWLTGKDQSPYKIIFLFIIIPVSIQFEFKYGLLTALVSSSFMLFTDIFLAPNQLVNTNLENDIIISAIFIMVAWLLSYYVMIEKRHSQMLEYKANTDVLTGLNNHRYFYEQLKKIYADKKTSIIALIFFDIDYFKEYNDMFGHLKGDIVLKLIGNKLKEILKDEEATIARYGGDEFAIILSDKTKDEAYEICETIRSDMEKMYFEGQEYLSSKNITVSIGIAFNDDVNSYINLIKRADDALYKAKFTRKNKVEVFSSVYNMIVTNMKEESFDLIASIKTLISVINTKDKYTYGHVERVVRYVKMLSDKLDLSKKDKETLIYGAYIHDIGKINIPEYILNKKTKLTLEEWSLVKQHPNIGVEIISQIDTLATVAPLVMHHHERFDGCGYPGGLQGKSIPYLARILTVADSFDAMTFNRIYKNAMTYDEAIDELKRCSGTQFDPQITGTFIEIVKMLKQ